jgi:uncharacterized integral membrane protein (TIGR00697 family)
MRDRNAPEQTERRGYRYYDLIMALFVCVLIVSNVASSAKFIDWGFSIFNVRMIFDAGTVLFPVSYIFGDVLTEVYGFKRSRRVIWTGFALLGFSSLIFILIRYLPGTADWIAQGGPEKYDYVLGGMINGGIAVASLLGYFIGEYSNSVVMAVMKVLTRGHFLWMRTIASTLVGEGLDTLVFVGVATTISVWTGMGLFQWRDYGSLVLTNYLFKCGIEALMTPVTYLIINRLKKVEHEDYYDYHTKLTPV